MDWTKWDVERWERAKERLQESEKLGGVGQAPREEGQPEGTNWAYGASNAAESVGILRTSRSTFAGAFGPRSDFPASTMGENLGDGIPSVERTCESPGW